MKTLYIALLLAFFHTGAAFAIDRELIVVNTLGETLDVVDLEDSTVSLFIDELGLFPNDIATSGNIGIAINSGSNDLYFYDLATMQRTGACFLGDSRNPYVGAFLNADTFYVTNLVSSTVTKVRTSDRSIITEFPVGDGIDADSPQGIVVRDRRAYICLASFNDLFEYDAGKLEVRDCSNDTLIARVTVGVNPQVARFGYDGYLYVLCTGNYADVEGKLYKINPTNNTVADSLAIGGYPGGLAITAQGVAFLAGGGWPPPVKMTSSGLVFVDRRETALPAAKSGGLVFTVSLDAFALLHGPVNPLNADWGVTSMLTVSDSTVITTNFADDTITEIDSAGTVLARFNVGDGPVALAKIPSCFAIKGDANGSGGLSISDAVYIITFIFGGGPQPSVYQAGDMNCSGDVTISDAVALISHVFGGGPGSCGCAD